MKEIALKTKKYYGVRAKEQVPTSAEANLRLKTHSKLNLRLLNERGFEARIGRNSNTKVYNNAL